MISELSVVAQSNVFLLPIFVERIVRSFVQVTLFDGNSSTAAQLTSAIAVFGFFLFALLFVFLLGRWRSEQVGSPSRLPGRCWCRTGRWQIFSVLIFARNWERVNCGWWRAAEQRQTLGRSQGVAWLRTVARMEGNKQTNNKQNKQEIC